MFLTVTNNRILRHTEMLISIITAFYCRELATKYKSEIGYFFRELDRLMSAKGLAFTVKYLKTSRLAVTRYISGHPLAEIDQVALSEGWPKWLIPLKGLLEEGVPGLKLLMTLVVSLRGVKLEANLDVEPIVEAWKGHDTITDREFNHACRQLGIRPTPVAWKAFHMSTKSGPIGQAITSSVTELTLLPQQLIDDIILLGGNKLGRVIEALRLVRWGSHSLCSIWAAIFAARSNSIRKISYFSDKEGKTRVIAILDYWSQTALRPLHDAINRILRRIKADCTFDQNSIFSTLPLRGPYFSLDLSNATDRMPISVQKRVIARLVGEDRAEAWARTLVGYEYNIRGRPAVSYAAGQPMGAYSSWGAMALTHHLLVRVSALRAGLPHFKDYCLLGDDLVIANAAVAGQYRTLCSQLDMPISEAKTHVSNDTFEFAKRWFTAGVEFTGFSIAGLGNVYKSYALLHNYLDTQRLHGWSLEIDRHPGLISSIYKLYGRPAQAERVVKLYMVFDSITKVLNGKEAPYSLISERVESFFGIQASLLVSHLQGETLCTLSERMMVQAKKRLVERDFERFQKDAYSVSAKLTGTFLSKFPDLSVQDYRAALRGNHPLVTVLNSMILESIHVLRTKFGKQFAVQTARSSQFQALGADTEMEVPNETYLNVGISKYFVSRGVFTMRASHSITLTKAQVVKALLDEFRKELTKVPGLAVPSSRQ